MLLNLCATSSYYLRQILLLVFTKLKLPTHVHMISLCQLIMSSCGLYATARVFFQGCEFEWRRRWDCNENPRAGRHTRWEVEAIARPYVSPCCVFTD